ncbi:hypothetical protein GCM10011386_27130 [Parapedobacter defluvii]|uniref:Uncharacterized protein n=1 Tax=Parapedobacter defluvii TaxID=2045106 RepID=A0ABQ1M2A6_9SPHI|nr:hypothetical protein [Parapedobacter defluvii]GGC33580.1 hypothetical protein GCM10011386_27130 [Parapedobacter defluvii]
MDDSDTTSHDSYITTTFIPYNINDTAVKRLIQVAMLPHRETLQTLQDGNDDTLSTRYGNIVGKYL